MNFSCPLPWSHLYIDYFGEVGTCCFSEFRNAISISDLASGTKKLEDLNLNVKKQMLNSSIPKECHHCSKIEEYLIESPRNYYNSLKGSVYTDQFDTQNKVRTLDLRFGNKCNLACRMCNPISSKLLLNDYRQYLNDPNYSKKSENLDWYKDIENIEYLVSLSSDLTSIYFSGGEPLLIKEHWDFLDEVISSNNSKEIELVYSTNLNFNLPIDQMEKWTNFKSVKLLPSMDGVGEVYNFIRFPGKFDNFDENLNYMDKEMSNLNINRISVVFTLQNLNILNLENVFEYLFKFKNIDNFPTINVLEDPKHFHFSCLPHDLKTLVIQKISNLINVLFNKEKVDINNINQLKYCLKTLKESVSKENDLNEFHKFNNFLDKKRNQNINQILSLHSFGSRNS